MTVQPEIVNKIADRIVACSETVAGKPIVTITPGRVYVEPKGADDIVRINRAWLEARKLGIGQAVIAELRRRGHDAGASVREAAE